MNALFEKFKSLINPKGNEEIEIEIETGDDYVDVPKSNRWYLKYMALGFAALAGVGGYFVYTRYRNKKESETLDE